MHLIITWYHGKYQSAKALSYIMTLQSYQHRTYPGNDYRT